MHVIMNCSLILLLLAAVLCINSETTGLSHAPDPLEDPVNATESALSESMSLLDTLVKYHRAAHRLRDLVHKIDVHVEEALVEVTPPAAAVDPEVVYVDNHVSCWMLTGVVQKIDYTHARRRAASYMAVPPAVVRCEVCLAIARKMNETLTEAQQMSASMPLSDDVSMRVYRRGRSTCVDELHPSAVAALLRSTCSHSFVNYGLREYKGVRSITEAYSYTDYVPSNMDNRWPQLLSPLCHEYLDAYGEMALYRDWLRDRDAVSLLCHNTGITRDCVNIDFISST